MEKCPVCETRVEVKHQPSCKVCAWELEWFLGDLSEEHNKEYFNKLKIHKAMYLKSIENDDPGGFPPNTYFGLRYLFVGIYLFVKYFIKFASWLILLGLLVVVFTIVFKELDITFNNMFSPVETGILVGFGIFVFITGIYMYKRFSK